ncbi:MAG: hypothetical protein C4530_09250 [Desulfobacteraceae bacterium]|nr:MAG: hypothetical protein C4530_09250 [Desulfobacteraceae bacterium]
MDFVFFVDSLEFGVFDMNLSYRSYRAVSSALFFAFLPAFWVYFKVTGRYRKSMPQRLGRYPDSVLRKIRGKPRIWIHAVSVGEVRSAAAIIRALSKTLPGSALVLSTGTEQGQAFARKQAGPAATCIYAPFDFVQATRKSLAAVFPDVLACVETEIWPNWLMEAHRMGIKTALVNGRISIRSVRRYLMIKPLMKEILQQVDAFSMIGTADAERLRRIGAPEERIEINGNAKYDLLLQQVRGGIRETMAARYRIDGSQPVFVAGSIRSGEVATVLESYEAILHSVPGTLLILAPRHIERVPQIVCQVNARGLRCQLRTGLDSGMLNRTAPVVVLDTIGELYETYSIASVVFCGGSLVPLGGQNVLEPAVWSKPVLYGPSMDDFLDAKELLDRTGGGIQVANGSDLAERTQYLLQNPAEAERIGRLAHQAVLTHEGAARKHAAVICRLLEG